MLKIGFTTKWFFDRGEVTRRMDVGTNKALSRFGAVVMRTARGSIRPAMAETSKARKRAAKPRPPSAPGSPPVNRTGLLRDHILFAYDPQKKSVVIGPELLQRSSMAQKLLELGGTARGTKTNSRRRNRGVGQSGEIRIGGKSCKTTKWTSIDAGTVYARVTGEQKRPVTYARLKTATQAARANRLNEELYGPIAAAIRIAPRPYMASAFQKTLAAKNHVKAFANIITK